MNTHRNDQHLDTDESENDCRPVRVVKLADTGEEEVHRPQA